MAIGDHLMISFGSYQHHAIDMGDGMAIQYGGGELSARHNRVSVVSIDSLAEQGSLVVIQQPAAFSGEEIVKRAKSRIEEQNYSLFRNNCEHFVNWCRTGQASSRQVDRAVERLASCAFKLSKKRVARAVSQRLGSIAIKRLTKSSMPWFLLADAAQLGAETTASHRGLNQAAAEKVGMATGLGTSVGIGTIAAGPVGAIAGAGIWAMGEAAGRLATQNRRHMSQ
jgi:hypothetical protein